MKKILVFSLCALLFTYCKEKEEETVNLAEYNDEMVQIQQKVDEELKNLIGVINSFDQNEMHEALETAEKMANRGLEKFYENKTEINELKFFNEEMENLLITYVTIIENQLTEIVEIYSLPDEEYTDEHKVKVTELFDSALTQYSIAIADFTDLQKNFARAHNLQLK